MEDGVALDAYYGVGLVFEVDDGGGGLVYVVDAAQGQIFFYQGIEGAAFYEGADFGQFGGRKCGCHRAVYVAGVFPFFLIGKESLLDGLGLAELRGGAGVLRGYFGMRVHGQREIAMDEIDLTAGDVIVHQLAIGGSVESFARGALEIAEDFENERSVLRAESLVGINVRDGAGGLGRRGHGH